MGDFRYTDKVVKTHPDEQTHITATMAHVCRKGTRGTVCSSRCSSYQGSSDSIGPVFVLKKKKE